MGIFQWVTPHEERSEMNNYSKTEGILDSCSKFVFNFRQLAKEEVQTEMEDGKENQLSCWNWTMQLKAW